MSNNSNNRNSKSMDEIDCHTRKEELKLLVIDAVSKECMKNLESNHDDIRAVAAGLLSGGKLQVSILTGGLCNYSYKVHFEDGNSSLPALFAKLTFEAPVGLPGAPPCSHERTKCEYDMLEIYSKVTPYPNSAITPYFCLDVVDNTNDDKEPMKLLVTEFSSKMEEQAANRFIEATVDNEFAIKLAKGLSSLHNSKVLTPDFNDGQKPFFHALANMLSAIFDGYLTENEQVNDTKNKCYVDAGTKIARMIGKEKLDEIMKVYSETLNRTDCYVHGDAHVFNMLVKSSFTRSSIFDDSDFCLVDFEMSHCGPIGKDLGFFHGFPIACALAHAVNGDFTSSVCILNFLDTLWAEYSSSVESNLNIADIYRQVLGFSSVFLLGYSALGVHMEYLPIDNQGETGAEDLAKVKESLSVIGLKLISIGFGKGNTMTILNLKNKFHEIINKEIQCLLPNKEDEKKEETTKELSTRQSSMLRVTGRRISDSCIYAALASEHVDDNGNNYASIVTKRKSIHLVEKLMIELEASKIL